MVVVAFLLVLAAAASFAAGIATSRTSDTLVYLSIVCSLAAFIILAAASMRARRSLRAGDEAQQEAEEAARVRALETEAATRVRSLETEAATGPLLEGLDETQLDMDPSWRRQARERWREEPLPGQDLDDEEDHLLRALEAEETEADAEVPVEPVVLGASARERHAWVVGDESDEPAEGALRPAPAFVFDNLFPHDDEDDEDILDVSHLESAPVVDDPIDDYDDLMAAEILPELYDLDVEELRWVEQRERTGAARATVLTQVKQLLVEHGTTPARTRPAKKTPAKKTTAKKTTAKKTTAKNAAAKKTGAKRAATTRTGAKKAAAKKTGAKKAAPTRTTSKTRRG